jgi:nitrogen fixation/metabolism regulation signal transduction histidine kinase
MQAAVEDAGAFSFLMVDSAEGNVSWHRLSSDNYERVRGELSSVRSSDSTGRLVLGDRLLIWDRVQTPERTITAGRLLPERFFALANQVVEGRTRYQTLSRTLLPVGKDLLLKIAIALIAISLILSLLAAQMLSYNTSAPLEKLVDATKRISAGDLKYRIPAGRRDEIGILIGKFNEMTAKLEMTTQELLTAEREMTWKETARTIAHEIKNLLTPVNIALFKIRQSLVGGDQAGPELVVSVDALSSEVEAIADLARQFSLFAHPPKMAPVKIDFKELIDESIALHQELAGNHQISVELADDLPELKADPDLMRRALSNLIKNALEATPYGGNVSVVVEHRDKATLLQVKDDGPGADQAIDLTLPYITTKKSGTGLGLAIAKKVCEAHGWTLSYDNLSPGFIVSITIPERNER